MSGYIYVMTNPFFSGTGPVKMYKIGYTADMEQREKIIKQLSLYRVFMKLKKKLHP